MTVFRAIRPLQQPRLLSGSFAEEKRRQLVSGAVAEGKPHLFLSAGDVAKLLNVGVTTVQRWRRKGELIPFVQIGNGKRSTFGYAKEDVMAFMEEKGDWQMPPWANPEAVDGAA